MAARDQPFDRGGRFLLVLFLRVCRRVVLGLAALVPVVILSSCAHGPQSHESQRAYQGQPPIGQFER
jgi:hypothetical protein